MVNYQLGKIYKIISSNLIYIGSTCELTLAHRMASHRNYFNRWKKDNNLKYLTSIDLLQNDDAEIILLESFPCNSRDELHARERFYIENNICVNKNIPSRTSQEYGKVWYEKNSEKIKEKSKKYHHEHRDDIIVKQKQRNDNLTESQKNSRIESGKKWLDVNRNEFNRRRRENRMKKKQLIMENNI